MKSIIQVEAKQITVLKTQNNIHVYAIKQYSPISNLTYVLILNDCLKYAIRLLIWFVGYA